MKHIRKEAAAVILKIVYGYNIEQFKKDDLLDRMNETMDNFGKATAPGAYMVDLFPFCKPLLSDALWNAPVMDARLNNSL